MRRPQASFEAQPRAARLLAPKIGIVPYRQTSRPSARTGSDVVSDSLRKRACRHRFQARTPAGSKQKGNPGRSRSCPGFGKHKNLKEIQRLVNCGARRAALRPYFLRSFILGSRVRKPAAFRVARILGVDARAERGQCRDGWRRPGRKRRRRRRCRRRRPCPAVSVQVQGLTDDQLQGLQAEIIVDVTAVDGDGAGAALIERGRVQRRISVGRCRKNTVSCSRT